MATEARASDLGSSVAMRSSAKSSCLMRGFLARLTHSPYLQLGCVRQVLSAEARRGVRGACGARVRGEGKAEVRVRVRVRRRRLVGLMMTRRAEGAAAGGRRHGAALLPAGWAGGWGWGACDGARVHALVLLVGVALRFLEEVGRGGVELPVEHLASGGRNQAAVRCQWGSGGGSGGGSRGGSGGPLGRWQWLGQARQEGRPRLPARAQLG